MTTTYSGHLKIVLAALAGAIIAILAAVLVDPKPWLLESSAGQRMLQTFLDWRAPVVSGAQRVREGDTVGDLALTTLDGRPVALDQHLGRGFTIVNLWATWCGPCLKELPVLEAFASHKPNAKIIAIGMDEQASVIDFLSRSPSKITQLLAAPAPAFAPGQLGNPAGVLPYSVLLDAQGRIIARRTGMFHAPADIAKWVGSSTR